MDQTPALGNEIVVIFAVPVETPVTKVVFEVVPVTCWPNMVAGGETEYVVCNLKLLSN